MVNNKATMPTEETVAQLKTAFERVQNLKHWKGAIDAPVCITHLEELARVSLGRRGGLASGPARMAKMTPEERSAIAKNAAVSRWAKREWCERKKLDHAQAVKSITKSSKKGKIGDAVLFYTATKITAKLTRRIGDGWLYRVTAPGYWQGPAA